MNISPISSNKYHISSNICTNNQKQSEQTTKRKSVRLEKPLSSQNKMIQNLEKQKSRLQEQMQKIKETDSDPKIKMQRINDIKKQIQQIDSQIQQANLSDINKKLEGKDNIKNEENRFKKDTKNDNDNLSVIDSSKFLQLSKADNTYSQMKEISKLRTDFKGKTTVLETQIESDISKGAACSDKVEELGELNGKISSLGNSIIEKAYEIQKEHDKSNNDKEGIKDTDKIYEEKNKKDKSVDLYI